MIYFIMQGNVGIGTTEPNNILDIKGNISISENLSCKGNIIVDNILINSETTFDYNLNLNDKLNLKILMIVIIIQQGV